MSPLVPAPCPSCSTPVEDRHRFCPGCGLSLDVESPTGTAPRRRPASGLAGAEQRPLSATHASHARGVVSGERFAPGTVLAGRYRIVGLLGRGGMGEVYRADDLKLEQPVALKFLPRALEGDADRLERLYGEVRMARQVSHPAVCRVWDVGEAEGQHFLSMEFVDGENLASLLRRIGRLPGDKARDLARQVAAGLAAAHEKGVLHRDLKPANVMVDGEGKVRLTDFGLAGFATSVAGEDVRSGTPSYMSPEQLQGREVTVRSDIYALGVLLYELFTGRRPFEGRTMAELARKHRDDRAIDPSVIVPDLDAAVEGTILACLEKDPRKRPPSASTVLAMLSGQDRLEAAIAAGETPSPELVAAAGEVQGLRPALAWAGLLIVLAAVVLVPFLRPMTSLLGFVPVEKSPEALEDRARELVTRLGAGQDIADSEVGLTTDGEYFRWQAARDFSPARWNGLRTGEPPVVQFWYRSSPRPLAAPASIGEAGWSDPPVLVSGMAGARYDLRGRLIAFYSVPPQVEKPAPPAPAPDWGPLLAEARLDTTKLHAVEPARTPPFFSDARAAWQGAWAERPEIPIRIEVASYRGRPVWFEIVDPWTRPERMQPFQLTRGQKLGRGLVIALAVLLAAVGTVLARRNVRLGRVDRRGAYRLATTVLSLSVVSWALRAHHVADLGAEFGLVARGAALAALAAGFLWLFYLALEPYVRRLRPWTLVSWTRALNGGTRDVVVGRDLLFGMTWGALLALCLVAADFVPPLLGRAAPTPDDSFLGTLLGTRHVLAYLAGSPVDATLLGLAALLLFLILRLATRRDWIAATLLVAILVVNQVGQMGEALWFSLPLGLLIYGTYVGLLLRFGVLAAIAGPFTANVLLGLPQSWALGAWTGSATALVAPLLAALAVLAFRTALGAGGSTAYAGPDFSHSRSS